ncbi:MAG: hypothetical protein L3J37_05810 [Rhodobacteraceae bacterium]|nr:hypothetical protein [Paracoccaceae bacterium]
MTQLGSNIGASIIEGREPFFATIFSILWVIGLAAYGAGYFGLIGEGVEPQGPVSLEVMLFVFAAVLPIVLVWIGVMLLRRVAEVQQDARNLAIAIKRFQPMQAGNPAARITPSSRSGAETNNKLAALSAQMQQVEKALVAILSANAGQEGITLPEPATPPQEPQEATTQSGLNWEDLLHALNFPTDEKDKDGFRALRIAMEHRNTSQCLRAAEDIMNLLSQDGIYMDDLPPEIAPAALWRRFAKGTRGEEVSAVGGIHDPTAVGKVRSRQRRDPIFRDAALHFQRQFDIILREFCREGSDEQIHKLANTRTGRSFMLLGRVNGMFG